MMHHPIRFKKSSLAFFKVRVCAIAMEIESTQIHFLSNVLVAVTVVASYLKSLLSYKMQQLMHENSA